VDSKLFKIFEKNKEQAYRTTFTGDNEKTHESGKQVLGDLRAFCGATKSNYSSDALEMARMEGRREVFNRITNYLKIDYDDYYELEQDFDIEG
jgi:hypothetical protein